MKLLPTLIAAVFAAASFSAVAADAVMAPAKAAAPAKTEAAAPKKLTAQQAKMKFCNKDAKEKTLKGDERKAFMKACLKKDSAASAALAPAA